MSADSLKRLMLRAEARIKPDKGENEKKKKKHYWSQEMGSWLRCSDI